jgi:flagellar biosynthesis GTPase FlhF
VDRYEIYDPSCLIFTKLDETSMRGAVVNELIRSGKPLAYFTMGQSVPDDIFKPSAGQLVDLTVGYKDEEAWPSLIHAARQVHKSRSASQSTRRQALEC